jgi:hypothetical protein
MKIVVDFENSQKICGGSRKLYFDDKKKKLWLSLDAEDKVDQDEKKVNDFNNIHEYILPCSDETGRECGWYLINDQIMNIRNQKFPKSSDFPEYKFPDYLKIILDWEEKPNEIILKRKMRDYGTGYSEVVYEFVSPVKELYKTDKEFFKRIQDRIIDVFYEFQDRKSIGYPDLLTRFYFGYFNTSWEDDDFGMKKLIIYSNIFWKIHLHSVHKKVMKFRQLAEESGLNTFYSNVPGGISDPMRQYLGSEALQNTQNKKRKLGE